MKKFKIFITQDDISMYVEIGKDGYITAETAEEATSMLIDFIVENHDNQYVLIDYNHENNTMVWLDDNNNEKLEKYSIIEVAD